MNYHPEDFIALSYAVESEGGACLADPCVGTRVQYKIDGNWERRWTSHCNSSARMEIPYNPALHVRLHDDEQDDVIIIDHPGEPLRDSPRVTVCAVDDAVGLWPRYSGVVSKRSFQS